MHAYFRLFAFTDKIYSIETPNFFGFDPVLCRYACVGTADFIIA